MSVSVYNQLHCVQRLQLKLHVSADILEQEWAATFHYLLLHRARIFRH